MITDFLLRPRIAVSIRVFATLGVLALSTPSARAIPPKPKEQTYAQTFNVNQAVDANAHTVTIATMVKYVDVNAQALAKAKAATPIASAPPKVEKTVTLLVTKFSEISVDGKTADLTALHAGMKVDVTKGSTDTEAAQIVATSP